MADDGMLLNFDLGSGPVKPQVRFKGGNWRDRKQAERIARRPGADRPATRPLAEDAHGSDRSSKRRRVHLDTTNDKFADADSSSRPPRARPSHVRIDHGGAASKPPFDGQRQRQRDDRGGGGGGGNQSKQVVSSLFTSNPEQKTVRQDSAWTAPIPTNAPLAGVASFGSLTLSSRLVQELSRLNIQRPTAIQQKVVPHIITGSSDAFVQAETGSGKTYAYLLPILHRILQLSAHGDGSSSSQVHRDSGIFAIMVAPTRELAKQTHTVLEQLLRPFPWLVSTAITGGESKKAEKARIRKGVNFLIATPGRLADHIDNTKALKLDTVRWLILDEGDRLMDLGFEDDLKKTIEALRKIDVSMKTANGTSLTALPDRRVTILCSATMKMNVQKLGEMSLADAVFISAEKDDMTADQDIEHKAPAQLHQSHVIVPAKLRLVTLICYLKSLFSRKGQTMKAIVFMSCADSVDFHYQLLLDPNDSAGAPANAKDLELVSQTVARAAYITSQASPEVVLHRMHGSLSQPVRSATLRTFSACKSPSVLITTDVSSRGLDIPSVDLVVEYDAAFSFADHIHRVGRTARAGRPGEAMLFLLPGCEEGYIGLLDSTAQPATAQSYEAILQKGLLSKLEFPVETSARLAEGQSYHDRAETLQLHLEQRLLGDARRLQLARDGFRSHVRAYATHVKEERTYFDLAELHLGHLAKSYGLREPPRGMGSGIDRKTTRKGGRGATAAGNDKEKTAMDQGAARNVLRKKGLMLMTGADEFNIG